MAGDSAGRIDLDLNLNQRGFDQQMKGIKGLAKKAGSLIAGAFAVKGLFDAVKLGSDLNEVQNVVDVTFTEMSGQVDKFAKGAAMSYGLSETMAKKFTGTFGAMSKAFGFTEKEAYGMATSLTALSGDLASFYNISQDEAYTKLKSVFTGETETLKDLGVVMTQNALDSYAMANGYGKTTKAMSEAEKVALRFAFVQDQLSLANGDFARTSDSWANQVRILKLQMESFMATVGQGLINIFTPVIKVINTLMSKLLSLANLFKKFTEAIMGKKKSESGLGKTADSAKEAEKGLAGAGSAAEGVGESAKKAGKEIKKSLAGFDELNTLSSGTDDGGSAGGGSGVPGGDFDFGSVSTEIGEDVTLSPNIKTIAKAIRDILQKTKDWYTKNFAPIFKDIGKELVPQIETFKKALGGVWSDIGTMGTPLKKWFLDDFTPFLQQVVRTAGDILVGMFDTFNMVFSDIWDVVIYPVLENFLTVGLPIITQFGTELVETIGIAFGEVKRVFDMVWTEGIVPNLKLIVEIWTSIWDSIKAVWDKWGTPIFEQLHQAFKNTADTFETIWNTILKPVWDNFMQTVDWLWTNHLRPLIDNFLNLVGTFIAGVLKIYNEFIVPLVKAFVETLGPAISNTFQTIQSVVGTVIGAVADIISGFITILTGLIQFVTGVFTGDWKLAWEGISGIFKGIFEGVGGIVKGVVNIVIDLINSMIRAVTNGLNFVIKKINGISLTVPNWIPGIGGEKIGFKLPPITAYKIPKLATGAVIPPNAEFLAMLGDQKSGNNIEAPEGLMRRIVNEESGNSEIAGLLRRLIEVSNQGAVLMVDGKVLARVVSREQTNEFRTGGKTLIPL